MAESIEKLFCDVSGENAFLETETAVVFHNLNVTENRPIKKTQNGIMIRWRNESCDDVQII